MGRMVHDTNGLHVVRIVNGTKSPDTPKLWRIWPSLHQQAHL